MKPIIVLVAVFLVACGISKLTVNEFEPAFCARVAMSVMLGFTATAHFAFTKGMTMMLPDFVPLKKELVYATGIIEIAAAIGLHIPDLSVWTAWLLIIFFVLTLPVNIYAAMKKVNLEKKNYTGKGVAYLWLRIPMQFFFIGWVYMSAIMK